MGEIKLDNCCRLCLKEGFSLTNIFSHTSAAGDPLYRILNFIYDVKISENDGLPSQICSPCMWRMIEFDACKKNVRSAEAEIVRLLSQTRPCMNEVSNHGSLMVSEDNEMDGAVEVGIVGSNFHSDATIKDEIDVFEMENPIETDIKEPLPETVQRFEEADFHDSESTEINVVTEVQDQRHVGNADDEEELVKIEAADSAEEIYNERVSSEQLKKSSQLPEVLNSICDNTAGGRCLGESSSINTAPENNIRIRHTNKGTSEKDLIDDVVQVQESQSAEQPKSVINDTKPGSSHLEAPLSNVKNRFKCDICKKGFQNKNGLGRHVRVHCDDRLFSCGVCSKNFKQDTVRYRHELRHLKDKMSDGMNDMGSIKKPFSCGICGRNFSSKDGLKRHSNLHSKKYSCSKCGKSFGNNFHLQTHLNIHTKEKSYECQSCFKSFNVKNYLDRHMASHSSDKPFACDVCKKKFKTKQSKINHELLHLKKKYSS